MFKRSYGTSGDIGMHRLSRRKWDGSGIKTRVRRKPYVTATEFIQLQTYLFLANVSSGYIIELYNDDQDGEEKIAKNPPLEFDDRWWNDEVVPALSSFVDDLLTSMQAGCIVVLDGF